jgi:hypothetical protein
VRAVTQSFKWQRKEEAANCPWILADRLTPESEFLSMPSRITIDAYVNPVDVAAAALTIGEGDLGPWDRMAIGYLTEDNERGKS